MKNIEQGTELKSTPFISQWNQITVSVDGEDQTGYIQSSQLEMPAMTTDQLSGYAAHDETHVFSKPDLNSDSLKSYNQGELLYFQNHLENWYKAIVFVDGERTEGFIHKDHINQPDSNPESLSGIGVKQMTQVYQEPQASSTVLKSYGAGTTLKFETFIEGWYKAVVYVNGKKRTGYISHQDVVQPVENPEELSGIAVKNQTNVYEDAHTSSSVLKDYREGTILKYETFIDGWYKAVVFIDGERRTGFIAHEDVEQPTDNPESLSGVAVKEQTNVYEEANNESSVLKDYAEGTILKYETFIDGWYKAQVIIDGERHAGYISHQDVEEPTQNPESLSGVATSTPTNVYANANESSNVLKDYKAGSVLRYETFINDWYKAEVVVNGERQTGYIHKEDVDQPATNPENLSGIAMKSETNIYKIANRASGVLKDYEAGSLLRYQTFINGWYKAEVIINGNRHTGYIHSSDVEQPVSNPSNLSGFGMKDQTNVYHGPNRDSGAVKSYDQGSLLQYTTYLDDWYKAEVIVNGTRHTGYINKGDVEEPVEEQEDLSGYAYNFSAPVYQSPNQQADVLKSYREGHLLHYQSLLDNWYEARVFVDGEAQTGYIHEDDVIDENVEQENLDGYANRDRVYVYEQSDRDATKLKGYNFGSELKFKSFTKNWYEASVFVDGERKTGYIHKNDITQGELTVEPIVEPETEYSYDEMVQDIEELTNRYSGLVSKEVIGQSVDGRNLYAVKVGNGDTKITINGAHHAREWITTNLLMHQIDTYSQAFMTGDSIDGFNAREILKEATIYYVPMVNLDGVTLVQEGPEALSNTDYLIGLNDGSRNFDAWKANARGVDLNRQYPADWDSIRNTEPFPGPERYKGTEPLSEPETQALADFTLNHDFKTAVAYHSSGEILYWDYYTSGQLYDDTLRIAEMIYDKTGYSLYYPNNPSGGGYKDWVLDSLEYPGYTPEVSPYVGDQPVPLSNYDRIWDQNYSIGLMLAKEAVSR